MKLSTNHNLNKSSKRGLTCTFLIGNLDEFDGSIENLPPRPFGLIVNADKDLNQDEWKNIFNKLLEEGVEWFASYGEKSDPICELFDYVYLDFLRERGEKETENNVLATIWCDTLAEALDDFYLINHDRSGERMEVAVVLE